MKIHPSVRQWILAFVAVDAFALLLMLGSCALRPVDCLETFTFVPLMMNVLVAGLALIPLGSGFGFPVDVAIVLLASAGFHALIGAAIGYVLRGRRIHPAVSFVAALVTVFAFAWLQLMADEWIGIVS